MSGHPEGRRRAGERPARSSAARDRRAGALAAFAPGTLPWGARAAGAPDGRGVRVFVIDAAPAARQAEPHDGRGGATARVGPHDAAVASGRALTAVVRHVAPGAEVLAVTFLSRGATEPLAVLEGALRHALRVRARVVSLDLALAAEGDPDRVRALCRDAARAGAILVGAAGDDRSRAIAAEWPEVIAAAADARLGARSLRYVRTAPLECRAAGWPSPLAARAAERDPSAHRFAAARVAGVVACILEARPRAELAAVRLELEAHFGRVSSRPARTTGP